MCSPLDVGSPAPHPRLSDYLRAGAPSWLRHTRIRFDVQVGRSPQHHELDRPRGVGGRVEPDEDGVPGCPTGEARSPTGVPCSTPPASSTATWAGPGA